MSQKILQINMNYSLSREEMEAGWLPGAEPISQVEGLRWKVWIVDGDRKEIGGIYLFENEAAVDAFLAGPIAGALSTDPTVSNVSLKQFDVMMPHSAITRGPVLEAARV